MKIIQLVVGMVSTNCYIVYDEKTLDGGVIDPGDDSDEILEKITEENVNIKFILLTHGHFDHIMAASDICEKTGGKIVVHKNDVGYLKECVVNGFSSYIKTKYDELMPDILAEDGTIIDVSGISFEYIHTPGHTPGSCIIKAENYLFTGDTLFKKSCGRCDLAGGNFSKILCSLKRISNISGDYNVLPGHGEKTTLQEEKKYNPYMLQDVEK